MFENGKIRLFPFKLSKQTGYDNSACKDLHNKHFVNFKTIDGINFKNKIVRLNFNRV